MALQPQFLNNMKIYIVKTISFNDMEPAHYSSYASESIEGVYSSHESALAKVDELHDSYRQHEIKYPEYYYFRQECRIEEHELIP